MKTNRKPPTLYVPAGMPHVHMYSKVVLIEHVTGKYERETWVTDLKHDSEWVFRLDGFITHNTLIRRTSLSHRLLVTYDWREHDCYSSRGRL